MGGDSNIDEVGKAIQDLIDGFDFTRPGVEESIGKDALHAIAEDIASSAAALQENPTGEPFPENEPEYADWKAKKYGMNPPAYGLRTGQTFSLESLLGDQVIGPDSAEMHYGTGKPPDRSSASGYISDSDKEQSDIEKMYWLQHGSDPIHPYEIGPYAEEAVRDVMEEGLRKHLGGG